MYGFVSAVHVTRPCDYRPRGWFVGPGMSDEDTRPWYGTEAGESGLIYQSRCVSCAAQHPKRLVIAISHGVAACPNCGVVPGVFRDLEAYRRVMRATRNRLAVYRSGSVPLPLTPQPVRQQPPPDVP